MQRQKWDKFVPLHRQTVQLYNYSSLVSTFLPKKYSNFDLLFCNK